MNIIDYIPIGRNNAVSRDTLSVVTSLDDRTIRNMIHEARREAPILNMQDGKGYFLPDLNDSVEVALLETYVNQENARLKSIGWSLMGARRALKNVQNNDQRTT